MIKLHGDETNKPLRLPNGRKSREPGLPSGVAFSLVAWIARILIILTPTSAWTAEPMFSIRVVDKDSDRGVPLVELRTTSGKSFVTDSHGYIAIDDPVLLGQKVFVHVFSHGYDYPADGFRFRGKTLDMISGGNAIIRIRRRNIAERMYRITGAGIYGDSVKLGKAVPIKEPLLNAQVTGQDSVQAVVQEDRIFWFWGDTNQLKYPLGNFNTSGATSLMPNAGGLPPQQGIDLNYFKNESGFSRPMFKFEPGVLIWIDGLFSVRGSDGQDRIVTHFSRRKSLEEQLSHGLAFFNHQENRFEPIIEFDEQQAAYPRGHAFHYRENAKAFIYFADPYSLVRVPASWEAAIDPHQYQAFTPLRPGSLKTLPGNLDRSARGELNFDWKRNTAPVTASQLRQWVQLKKINEQENRFRTVDVASGKSILLHRGSIRWNKFRQRWIMVAHEAGGESSYLGEVWYAESKTPTGPFPAAIKICTHNNYSFYNVTHHDFFDQEEGKLIYFEGTYTKLFAKTKVPTPRYDYNQIMYRLDLSDRRLRPAFVE